jgi:hypothetical protein
MPSEEDDFPNVNVERAPHDNATSTIVIVIITILLAAGLILLIWWITRGSKTNTDASQLSITGLNVTTQKNSNNTNTLIATWTGSGNNGNNVILYADTVPINLNANGIPSNPNVLKSNLVSVNTRTVSISTLTSNTKYYYDLIVTNPNISGFNPEPGVIYTGSIPSSSFIIQQISTPGGDIFKHFR